MENASALKENGGTAADDELLTPDQVARMNHPFDIEGIRREMEKMLSKPKCAAFVKQLLELAVKNGAADNKLVENGDVVKIFDKIVSQRGLVRAGDTANGAIGGASFASGRIKDGTARIQIGVFRPGQPITRKQARLEYLKNDACFCIHETLHHASELGYSDEDFAIAVSTMIGNNPELPATTDSFKFSKYWDTELRKSYA